MANIEKVVPAPEKSEPGFWRLLVAFLTDPGCRQAFREGWKEGWNEAKAKQDIEAKEKIKFREEANKELLAELDNEEDNVLPHKLSFPNVMIIDTPLHNPYLDTHMIYDPYGCSSID